MRICITSQGESLDSSIDQRFGRCRYFVFFDTDSGDFQARLNPNAEFQGGAGIQSGQLMAAERVGAVLTGNIGPNAHQVLSASGISIFTGVCGTVKDAIEGYKSGKYKPCGSPTTGAKSGMQGKING
jgi:predicted Fe-Mo cluster-binding NifX family protein